MTQVPLHITVHAVGYAALSARLLVSGLYRTYPFFSSYVAFELARVVSQFFLRPATVAYAYVYFFTQPVAWILSALIVLEVFQVSLKAHPGISSMGRKAVTAALLVATAVSLSTLFLGANTPRSPFETLERYLLVERIIYSSLLVFLLMLLGFLAYFPVPLSRNAMLHAGTLGFYFVSRTVLWILRNLLGPEFTGTQNLTMAGVVTVALAMWTVFLTRAGEEKTIRSSRRADKAQEERLIAQLERLNSTLSRSGRR